MPTYRLTKKLKIYRRKWPANDFEPTGSTEDSNLVATPWAEVRALSASERQVLNQTYPTANYQAAIRRGPWGISPEQWVEVEGRRFDITGVVEDDEGLYLRLYLTTTDVAIGGGTLR